MNIETERWNVKIVKITKFYKGELNMNAIGRIGVIMPEIIDPLNYELLGGIQDRAKQLGYDVLVFTGVFNSQAEFRYDSHMIGLDNIYELVSKGRMDGILFAADLFYNARTKQHIYDLLRGTDTPCLILGEMQLGFPSLFASQRSSMRMMTEHLIHEHQYRNFYYISGIPGHFDSNERMAGFLEALNNAGLPWDGSRLFYGNFWREEPRRIAERIASGELERPDAVVCASDVMAAAFCTTLAEHGIRVPEDIAVTGFDGGWDAYAYEPQITTISGRYQQFGMDAVNRMHTMLGGRITPSSENCQKLCFGGSCGCKGGMHSMDAGAPLHRYIRHRIERTLVQKKYIAANLVHHMDNANDLAEFLGKVDTSGCVLPEWEGMDLCLCRDWMFDFENPEECRHHGFSDTMHLALSKHCSENVCDQDDFSVEALLPVLEQPHTPKLVIFTSLHSEGQIFGYAATTYETTSALFIDEHYVNWLDAVNNGLRTLQKKLYQDHQKQQLEALSIHDPATGLFNKKGFLERVPAFLESCRAQQKTPSLMLLSYVCRTDASADLGIDTSLIIANALRLSAGEDEVYARMDDHVFAVLLACDTPEECGKCRKNRIFALERKIQYLQGNAAGMQMPELISNHCSFGEETISMEVVLEQSLVRITEKAAAARNCSQGYKEQFQKLRREIYLNPQEDWNVPLVLKRIGISRSHFYRIYKEQFTVSYTADLIQARLDKAQQLLLYTDMRLQEIAEQCGYGNENHFMRQFKERFGMTPSRFRQQCA